MFLTTASAHGITTFSALLTIVISTVGTLALGWAIFRAQALSGWRAAAEGYRAQNEEMKPRLERAERLAVSLQAQITELERRPDLSDVHAAVLAIGARLDFVLRGSGGRDAVRDP